MSKSDRRECLCSFIRHMDFVTKASISDKVIDKAIDKPGCKNEKEIKNRRYPTVWNQIEAAMAFGQKIPLLVIMEDGIYQEAMLKDRLEYRALVTNLDKKLFSSDEFRGIFTDWKRIAEARSKEMADHLDVKSITIGKLIKELSTDKFWNVGVALFGLLSGIAIAAYWAGKTLSQ